MGHWLICSNRSVETSGLNATENLRPETLVLQDGRQHDGEEVLSAIVDRLHQDLVSAPFKVTGQF